MATLDDALDNYIEAYKEFVDPDEFRIYTKAEALDAALISIANTTSFLEIEKRLTDIYLKHDNRWQRIYHRFSTCPPLLNPLQQTKIRDYMDTAIHGNYLKSLKSNLKK